MEAGRTIECLIEVNCSGEASKSGVAPDDALPFRTCEVASLEKYAFLSSKLTH